MILLKFSFHQLTPWFFKSNTTFDIGTWGITHLLPPISTLIGAIRGAIGTLAMNKGRADCGNWWDYQQGRCPKLEKLIGKYSTQEDLPFLVYGPFIGDASTVFFPLPSIVKFEKAEDGNLRHHVATLSEETHTYKIPSPSGDTWQLNLRLFSGLPGRKLSSSGWLSLCEMDKFLKGDYGNLSVSLHDFATVEEEIGIAIDDEKWTVKEKAMYRIRRVFMREGYHIVAYALWREEADVPVGDVIIPFGGRKGLARVEVDIGEDMVKNWIVGKNNLWYLASDHYIKLGDKTFLDGIFADGKLMAAATGKPVPYRPLAPGKIPGRSGGTVKHLTPRGSIFVFDGCFSPVDYGIPAFAGVMKSACE